MKNLSNFYALYSFRHLKERNDDLTQRRKSVTKDNLTETKNDGVTQRRKSITKDAGPELVTGLLPPVTGSKIRSTSVSRKRKKPRLQLVKDRVLLNEIIYANFCLYSQLLLSVDGKQR